IERMTAKKVEERIPNAADVAAEIKRLQTKFGLSAERIATGETMILKRLAKGSASGAQLTPAEHTTGNRPARSAPLPASSAGTTGVRVRTAEIDTASSWLR